MKLFHSRGENRLLSELYIKEFDGLITLLRPVLFQRGQVLHRENSEIETIYFPTTAIISIECVLENGSSVEVANIGNEGMVGTAVILGSCSSVNRAVVQVCGHGYSIASDMLKAELQRKNPLQNLLMRYTQSLMTQYAQSAVCSCHHSTEQRFCRWILQTMDRVGTADFAITQEEIAQLLGVRRETITESAGHLQSLGAIRYRRGQVRILDRLEIEKRSCECYVLLKVEFDRLLPQDVVCGDRVSRPWYPRIGSLDRRLDNGVGHSCVEILQ